MNFFYETEIDSQTQKTNVWLLMGWGGGINQEFGINRYTSLYVKQINRDLQYSSSNYSQYLVKTYNWK